MANTIVITAISGQTAGQAFKVSGTSQAPAVVAGSIPPSAMFFKDDAGNATAFPAGSTVPGPITIPGFTPPAVAWSYMQPALAAGTHSITVTDASGGTATASVTVNPANSTFNAILSSNDGASLTLPDGKTVTIDNAYAPNGGNIKVNNSNVPGGDHSFAVAVVGGVLYGQDGSNGSGGQWYSDTGETSGNWQAVNAPAGLVYFGGPPPPPPPSGGSNLTQAQVNAVMSAINTIQVEEVPAGECFSGTCYPQNGRAHDWIITDSPGVQATGIRGTLIDRNGTSWSLHAGTTAPPQPPDWWWGGIDKNGSPLFGGYSIAIRLVNGEVWVQEAKQGGWWSLTANGGSPNGTYVGDPGAATYN